MMRVKKKPKSKQLPVLKTEKVLGKVLKVYGTPENPLFVAKDVADWIEHSNPRGMIKQLDPDEKGVSIVYTLGGPQEVSVITEYGLYEVLMSSRKQIAKAFKKEVKRIVKELRIHGFTATEETLEKMISDPDLVIRLATELKESRAALSSANKTIQRYTPKVEYYDGVLCSNSDFNVTTIAKELGLSAIALNNWMHWMGFQFKQDRHWVLYSKYAGRGYTSTRTYRYGENLEKTSIRTTFTQKGREWIHNEWKKYINSNKTINT